jgi:hypothetical protein
MDAGLAERGTRAAPKGSTFTAHDLARVNGRLSPEQAEQFLADFADRGVVVRHDGGWALTPAGHSLAATWALVAA